MHREPVLCVPDWLRAIGLTTTLMVATIYLSVDCRLEMYDLGVA